MFRESRRAAAWLLLALCTGSGCTVVRELPRGDYAARPERSAVRVSTADGLQYEFGTIRVDGDSLTGFREPAKSKSGEHAGAGANDAAAGDPGLKLALQDIRVMSVRQTDWYRTGLLGVVVLAGVIAAGIAIVNRGGDDNGSGTDDGKVPPVP